MNIHTTFASLGGGSGRPAASADPTSPVDRRSASSPGSSRQRRSPTRSSPTTPTASGRCSSRPPTRCTRCADSPRMREALDALDLVVVIDVALTETARRADYVLPAASQYEKWEATFFTLEFPENAFHLRRAAARAAAGTLPEPEIHGRLVRALGRVTDDDLAPLQAAAEQGRAAFADAFLADHRRAARARPAGAGRALRDPRARSPDGDSGVRPALWGLAQMCCHGLPRVGAAGRVRPTADEPCSTPILAAPSGVVFTVDEYDETWRRSSTADGRVAPRRSPSCSTSSPAWHDEDAGRGRRRLPVRALGRRAPLARPPTPSSATRRGGRRTPDGALRMYPDDAAAPRRRSTATGRGSRPSGARPSPWSRCTDTLQPGPRLAAQRPRPRLPRRRRCGRRHGVAPNELTSSDDRDWLAGTPHHKHVPARIEALDRRARGISVTMDSREWIAAFAAALGVDAARRRHDRGRSSTSPGWPPTPPSAPPRPIACYLVGRAGLGADEASPPWPPSWPPDVRRTRFDDWPCPIARTTDLMGDWWTPLVHARGVPRAPPLRRLPARRSASPAPCSSQRLARLVDEGLLEKQQYEEHPPRYEYRLTDKGRAFWDVLAAMWRYGDGLALRRRTTRR